jgi:hypothetical protein
MDRSASRGHLWKADSADRRYYLGCLALTPAALSLGLGLRHSPFCHSHPALTWALLGAAGLVSYIGSHFWARRVPSLVSLYLGVILWAATLWLFGHGQI